MKSLLLIAAFLAALCLGGCAPMAAGRQDAEQGTPFKHVPTSGNPIDLLGYLTALGVGIASGAGGTHAYHRRKKKAA